MGNLKSDISKKSIGRWLKTVNGFGELLPKDGLGYKPNVVVVNNIRFISVYCIGLLLYT